MSDGTEFTADYKEKEHFEKNPFAYYGQHRSFERGILEELDEDVIEDYAKRNLYLISEDDCDCSDEKADISMADSDEIETELLRRSELTNSVLNEGAIERFMKMMEDKGPVFIDELLTKNGF